MPVYLNVWTTLLVSNRRRALPKMQYNITFPLQWSHSVLLLLHTQRNGDKQMTIQENQARMNAATEASRKDIEAVLAEVNSDPVADYWANSASQSYCNAVESGNVQIREVG